MASLHVGDSISVAPASEGKWTDLLLPLSDRQLFRHVVEQHFVGLSDYGNPELGTVTGANDFFAINEQTRERFNLTEGQVAPICPPGSRHLKSTAFTKAQWRRLRDAGERVWLLHPDPDDQSEGLRRYIRHGEAEAVDQAYKCQVRSPWWRPPMVSPPDLFFTYMSHRYPRLVHNAAGVSFVNSMHGVRLKRGVPGAVRTALPLLAFNSVTMLGAEIHGRAYGGGILKMEPKEAAVLPVPATEHVLAASNMLTAERDHLDRLLKSGLWTNVAKRVDEILLQDTMRLSGEEVAQLHGAAASLRARRMGHRSTT